MPLDLPFVMEEIRDHFPFVSCLLWVVSHSATSLELGWRSCGMEGAGRTRNPERAVVFPVPRDCCSSPEQLRAGGAAWAPTAPSHGEPASRAGWETAEQERPLELLAAGMAPPGCLPAVEREFSPLEKRR